MAIYAAPNIFIERIDNMLTHPTLDQLQALGLQGMAKAFVELDRHDDASTLSHAEWLALLLDRETTWRHDKRLTARLRYAKLRHRAVPEDVDYRSARGLDRRLFEFLLKGEWIDAHDNLAICGPTGIGKSWLACAIGHKACRDNRSVLYVRFTRLLDELALARGDGRIASRMKSLANVELLILDDCWGGRLPTASRCATVMSLQDSHEGAARDRHYPHWPRYVKEPVSVARRQRRGATCAS